MSFHFKLLKEISSNYTGNVNEDILISSVFIDSREQVQNGLFIPIIGDRFDGHDFLQSAIENGAIAALWDEIKPLPKELAEQFPIFFVNNTLLALQNLAQKYLLKISPKVIGVTGSNGKTTVKDLLEGVLTTSYKTHKTAGNYNNHIGLPLTILDMPNDCEVVILEMGMNHFGEISFLSMLAKPEIAVITNIGESHVEQLGSREGIAKAKLEIVDGLKEDGVLIFDGDEPLLNNVNELNKIKCGYNETNDFQITSIEQTPAYTNFTLNNQKNFQIRLLGKHNVKNSTYAIAVGKYLGLSEHTIQRGLDKTALTAMRMEKKLGINGSTIINDAYNSSPTSMKAAIETVKELTGFKNRILVLGDMYELGKDEKELHRSVAESITHPITHLFTLGEKGKWISEALLEDSSEKIEVETFQSRDKLIEKLKSNINKDSIVLIKASRGMKLETIATALYR